MQAPVEHRSATDPLLYPFRVVTDDVAIDLSRNPFLFLFITENSFSVSALSRQLSLPRHRLDDSLVLQSPPVGLHLLLPPLVGEKHLLKTLGTSQRGHHEH
jgi:hypothetical protein